MSIRAVLLSAAVVVLPCAAQDAAAARKPKEPVPAVRPLPRKIKGLKEPLGVTDRALLQAVLRDLGSGLVVVVEEEAPTLKPSQVVRFGNLRVLARSSAAASGLPLPPWMDNAIVLSGGNTVAQVFPLGWGYR